MLRERYVEIDIARGIAAYLVILGHCLEQIAGKNILLITYCHMPVFFWIGGFVLQHSLNKLTARRNEESIWGLIKKKVRRLLLPYLVWSAVAWSANVFVETIGGATYLLSIP